MGQKTKVVSAGAEREVKDLRCKTRKSNSTEDKIRIVLAGLRGEDVFLRYFPVLGFIPVPAAKST